MALLPLNLDYTDKDFTALRVRLFSLIDQVFPDWTDRDVANFGTLLVELFAHIGDVLGFYQDNQAQESRLSDAQLRSTVLAVAKMLNYTPEGNAAATANVLVTLSEVPLNNVVLEAGRKYETAEVTNRIEFQQLFDTTITAGLDPPQVFVQVENSEDADDVFASNSLPSQEFELTSTPYLDSSIVLTAINGAYTEVDNFLDSAATDRHFTVDVDEDGRALIRMGDGVNGEIPTGQIDVFYKTGGGAAGNVDVGSITRTVGAISDVNGTRVQATVTNTEAATGGVDRETVASVKQKAPASTKVTDRTVSVDDYEIGAVNVAGIARALMITSDEVTGVPENRGFLYVVPDGGGAPSDSIKDSVLTEVTVTRPNTITFKVSVEDPTYLTVDVAATVFFEGGFNTNAVVTAINTALSEYFQITNADGTANDLVKFGAQYGDDMSLPMSDLFCVVEAVSGVRKIGTSDVSFLLNLVHGDLVLQYFEFPVLGTVTITNGETGEVVAAL